jgi:hypothetical protein
MMKERKVVRMTQILILILETKLNHKSISFSFAANYLIKVLKS